ncbi:MAG: hypothetical protein K9G62_08885 [Alphaproteobacteria bacterium]|nr:hypothetical protein [Alphaproteobacteria bacterium]
MSLRRGIRSILGAHGVTVENKGSLVHQAFNFLSNPGDEALDREKKIKAVAMESLVGAQGNASKIEKFLTSRTDLNVNPSTRKEFAGGAITAQEIKNYIEKHQEEIKQDKFLKKHLPGVPLNLV